MSSPAASQARKRPNLIQSAVLGLITRDVTVTSIEPIGDRFRLFTVAGEGLKRVAWTPGWKTKLDVEAFTLRVYTPISWDSERGEVRYLALAHRGGGPGARWIAGLQRGDIIKLAGPRHSLDFTAVTRPALFFGDETSIGPAASFAATARGMEGVRFIFEADDAAETMAVLDRLGLGSASVVERLANDAHLPTVEAKVAATLASDRPATFILTGKAMSIQHLNRTLRGHGVTSAALMTKAYWAPGKIALD